MAILLGDYEKLVLHKYIEMDRFAGAQCWDLFAHYCNWLGIKVINTFGGQYEGWAYAIWDQFAVNGASAEWVQIPATAKMEQGDVPIWKPTPGYYPGSHIALGLEDAGPKGIWCLSQNSAPAWAGNPYPGLSTAPVIKQLLPKVGLAGYLRRKTVAPTKTVAQLADEVLAGKHGVGAARAKSLGPMFNLVQKEVDRRLAKPAKPKPVDIGYLARGVIAGNFGIGEARKRRLGANFAKVQAEVDRIMFQDLVTNTLNGKYGVGEERKRRLGGSYAAVQAEINRRG